MLGKPRRQRHWGIPMEFIACNDLSEPLPTRASRLPSADQGRPPPSTESTGKAPGPIHDCSNASLER